MFDCDCDDVAVWLHVDAAVVDVVVIDDDVGVCCVDVDVLAGRSCICVLCAPR